MRWVPSWVVIGSVTVLLAVRPASALTQKFHSDQNGYLTIYLTQGEERVATVYSEPYTACQTLEIDVTGGDEDTNVDPDFQCHGTGQSTGTSECAPYYDVGTGQWEMHGLSEWEGLLGLSDDYELWMPGMTHDLQDLFVAVDLLAWQAGNGTYEMTGAPDPLRYYQFTDGMCDELPGVFLSVEPLAWNPDAPETDPYHGFASSGWYTSGPDEIYICHELGLTPEPGALSLAALGGLALLRRRRGG